MIRCLVSRATTKTNDITGGLRRVVALFKARHPRDKAAITEVDDTVHHGPVVKGMRRIIIETDEGTRHEYSVPRSVDVNVQEGERVRGRVPLIAVFARRPRDPENAQKVVGSNGTLARNWGVASSRRSKSAAGAGRRASAVVHGCHRCRRFQSESF